MDSSCSTKLNLIIQLTLEGKLIFWEMKSGNFITEFYKKSKTQREG